MDNGFIKLHRKMLDWEWFSDSKTLVVFLYLLLDANHAEKKWQGNIIQRGQTITSVDKIKLHTKISIQSIRTCFKRLEATGEITVKTTNRFTIVTICNYDDYQSQEKITNKQITNDQQTDNKQLTTNKNEKKQTTPIYTETFLSFWGEYPNKTGKGAAFKSWQKAKGQNIQLEIMEALKEQKSCSQWTKDNGQYIPNPSTWLNQRRWEDETTPETTSKPSWMMGG